jgi:hypothetical protein
MRGSAVDFEGSDLGGSERIYLGGFPQGQMNGFAFVNGTGEPAAYDVLRGVVPVSLYDLLHPTGTANQIPPLVPTGTNGRVIPEPPGLLVAGLISVFILCARPRATGML